MSGQLSPEAKFLFAILFYWVLASLVFAATWVALHGGLKDEQ